jgi:hypothetical protein
MRYVSKSEPKAASKMTRTQVIEHICRVADCEENGAISQMASAIADRKLWPQWEDWRRPPLGSSGTVLSDDEDTPPTDPRFWLKLELDPIDRNLVREPPCYDPKIVKGKLAATFDSGRRFRKPLFPKEHVLMAWPILSLSGEVVGPQVAGTLPSKATAPELARALPIRKDDGPSPQKRRGPSPHKREAIVARMGEQLQSGELTPKALMDKLEKELEEDYGVSRDTARKARNEAIRSFSPTVEV